MNKPVKENYIMDGRLISSVYATVLEDYVEELEKVISKLEKAVDRACELLEDGYGDEYPYEMYNKPFIDYMTVEEWKEWLLKDE